MASKPMVSPEIIKAWTCVSEKKEKHDNAVDELVKQSKKGKSMHPLAYAMIPPEPTYKDVYPLITAVKSAPKAFSGETRKRKDDLILLPRSVVDFLAEAAMHGLWKEERDKSGGEK